MSQTLFFSVILTTYNRAELLPRAINSLISQLEKDFEVIIIDDGSEDNTPLVIKDFENSRLILSYHRNEKNLGVICAKNKGIELSKGKYITFLDSDDEYKLEHLKSRRKILEENPQIDLLHGGIEVFGNPYVPDLNDLTKQISISKCVASGTFFINRKRCFDFAQFEGDALSSDATLFDKFKERNRMIHKTEIPTYIYHHEEHDSITNSGKCK